MPGTGLLAGCATSGGGQEQSEGEKSDTNPLGVPTDQSLEIYIFNGGFGDKYATEVHEPMFAKAYPKAKIVHKAEVDIAGALQSRFVGGNPPDFVNDSGDGQIPLGQLVSDKQLYDLTDLFDAPSWDDPDKKVSDTLVPGAIEQGTFGDKPYVMHMALTIFGLWYNKTLFDEKGWTLPTTWAEMTDLCKDIKAAGIAPWTYQGIHARYMNWPLLTMAAKLGGPDVLKAIDNLEEGAWGHEAVKESANALAGLRKSGYILEGTEGMDHIQAQKAVVRRQGRVHPVRFLAGERAEGRHPGGLRVRLPRRAAAVRQGRDGQDDAARVAGRALRRAGAGEEPARWPRVHADHALQGGREGLHQGGLEPHGGPGLRGRRQAARRV